MPTLPLRFWIRRKGGIIRPIEIVGTGLIPVRKVGQLGIDVGTEQCSILMIPKTLIGRPTLPPRWVQKVVGQTFLSYGPVSRV